MHTKQKLPVGYIWLLVSNLYFRAMKTIWGENEKKKKTVCQTIKRNFGQYLEIGWSDKALMKPFYIYVVPESMSQNVKYFPS